MENDKNKTGPEYNHDHTETSREVVTIKTIDQIKLEPEINIHIENETEEEFIENKNINCFEPIVRVKVESDQENLSEIQHNFYNEPITHIKIEPTTLLEPEIEIRVGKELNLRHEINENCTDIEIPEPEIHMKVGTPEEFSKFYINENKSDNINVKKFKKLECSFCGNCFNTKLELADHVKSKCEKLKERETFDLSAKTKPTTKARNFECTICHKKFVKKSNLKGHVLIHEGVKEHACDICGKSFTYRSNLKEHVLTHSNAKNFECSICNRKFGLKNHLHRHMLNHKDVKPHQCSFCDKSYNNRSHLRDHLVTHTNEKNFECHVCKKKFSQKSHLNRHILIHEGVRSFECEFCDSRFYLRANLTRHMLKHSGERNFECEICQKKFSIKSNLNKHITIHENVKKKCSVCNEMCEDLTKHMTTHAQKKTV